MPLTSGLKAHESGLDRFLQHQAVITMGYGSLAMNFDPIFLSPRFSSHLTGDSHRGGGAEILHRQLQKFQKVSNWS